MIKLEEITIHKYKSIVTDQTFDIEKDVTVLVGMNESGKTSIIEAIAKTNYFDKDEEFEFSLTHDYPRKEKKRVDKSGDDPKAITCRFKISDDLAEKIVKDVGSKVLIETTFTKTTNYSNTSDINLTINFDEFAKNKAKEYQLPSGIDLTTLKNEESKDRLQSLIEEQDDEDVKNKLQKLLPYFVNQNKWYEPVSEYIYRTFLKPNLPKYLYYDEYYSLPSRISINKLRNENLTGGELKTAKALFELADINIEEIINSDNFEDFKAELEATEATISEILFKYWKTNRNLRINFDIDKIENFEKNRIIEHVLDIRVRNDRAGVSLPLRNRSKGFNWFFSFLVWFEKIQEDKDSTYVLLLDEPGLNLHASAQEDLLAFIEDLSKNYQIVYTTHSPFMIESAKLSRVRTIVETENGSKISDSIQEKDPNTLFPLQAALGYNIAQNLFISKNNLLVEGVSDLVYLELLSAILSSNGRTGLSDDITIVPIGGLEKVATFISLLRSNKLNIVCLLDSVRDPKVKSNLDKMIREKLINDKKIKFFHDFLSGYSEADIEDLFHKSDYVKIYNEGFPKNKISLEDLNPSIKPILIQINQVLSVERFNHYLPANAIARRGADIKFFETETLDNFEKVFKTINSMIKTS